MGGRGLHREGFSEHGRVLLAGERCVSGAGGATGWDKPGIVLLAGFPSPTNVSRASHHRGAPAIVKPNVLHPAVLRIFLDPAANG